LFATGGLAIGQPAEVATPEGTLRRSAGPSGNRFGGALSAGAGKRHVAESSTGGARGLKGHHAGEILAQQTWTGDLGGWRQLMPRVRRDLAFGGRGQRHG